MVFPSFSIANRWCGVKESTLLFSGAQESQNEVVSIMKIPENALDALKLHRRG